MKIKTETQCRYRTLVNALELKNIRNLEQKIHQLNIQISNCILYCLPFCLLLVVIIVRLEKNVFCIVFLSNEIFILKKKTQVKWLDIKNVCLKHDYSTFKFFCRNISWYISNVFKALKLKLDTRQNWFQSKRYVIKIVRKNSQRKKSTFTTLKGCLKNFGVRGQIGKLPLKRSKNRFFWAESFF